MKTWGLGTAIATVGAVYLAAVAWMSSWWYVPALTDLHQAGAGMPGDVFFIVWGCSGVLGAVVVALGAAASSNIGQRRLLLLTVGGAALVIWLVFWSAPTHNVVYGVGGGLILLFFLASCLEWARKRPQLEGIARTASDLRLAAYASFFIAAWGLCGLLGAPIFLLRSDLPRAAGTGSTLAAKVLVCLVLGWGLIALAERMERRDRANRNHAAG